MSFNEPHGRFKVGDRVRYRNSPCVGTVVKEDGNPQHGYSRTYLIRWGTGAEHWIYSKNLHPHIEPEKQK